MGGWVALGSPPPEFGGFFLIIVIILFEYELGEGKVLSVKQFSKTSKTRSMAKSLPTPPNFFLYTLENTYFEIAIPIEISNPVKRTKTQFVNALLRKQTSEHKNSF